MKSIAESITCEKQLCHKLDLKFNNWVALHLAVFGEGMDMGAGDDKVVEDAHVHQRQRLHQRAREQQVGLARFGRAGRVVVGQHYAGGVVFQRRLHHF